MTSLNTLTTIVLVTVILLAQQQQQVRSENILFYFALTGFSHLYSIWPLAEELALNGHNITIFTPYPTRKENVHENITTIVSDELLALFKWDENADLIHDRLNDNHLSFWDTLLPIAYKVCEIVLRSEQTSNLVHNSKFDLVFLDAAYNECGMSLAHYKYDCPYIIYSAVTINGYYHDTYGLPMETSVISDLHYDYASPLSFYEKLSSTLNALKWSFYMNFYYYGQAELLVQQRLGLTQRPSFAQLNAETSLFFMNTFPPSTDYARALPPNFISVGGMQLTDKRKPLPANIVRFLARNPEDSSNYLGFIVVSFGTAVRISKSNSDIRQKLFNAMGNFTQLRFIWKWEGEIPEDAPANIFFSAWLPQQDLLAHKDILGVINHGGLNGVHEAIYFELPMIIFPIFADQDFSANSLLNKGLGIKLEITTFTQVELANAINDMLTNKELKNNMKKASVVFKDRPMNPVQTGLWWTNYVLRHKNTTLWKPVIRHLSWYEKRLLDVWYFIFVVVQLVLALIIYLVYKMCTINNMSSSLGKQAGSTSNGRKIKNGVKSKLH